MITTPLPVTSASYTGTGTIVMMMTMILMMMMTMMNARTIVIKGTKVFGTDIESKKLKERRK